MGNGLDIKYGGGRGQQSTKKNGRLCLFAFWGKKCKKKGKGRPNVEIYLREKGFRTGGKRRLIFEGLSMGTFRGFYSQQGKGGKINFRLPLRLGRGGTFHPDAKRLFFWQ